jgi:tetratricopeptide (TPR) repeat protein
LASSGCSRTTFRRRENLGFYWAHARLAGAALALADTTAALAELEQAVELEGRDPVLRLYDGAVLRDAGRFDEAIAQLRKAVELDPYYAAPRYWLATVYQAQGKTPEAIEQYRLFLGHAAWGDADRARAIHALTALGASTSDSAR